MLRVRAVNALLYCAGSSLLAHVAVITRTEKNLVLFLTEIGTSTKQRET